MLGDLRKRFWVEVALGSLTTVLLIVTLVLPQWIELVFRVEPDAGSGSLEWLLVGVFAVTTAAFAVFARSEWRRAAAASGKA